MPKPHGSGFWRILRLNGMEMKPVPRFLSVLILVCSLSAGTGGKDEVRRPILRSKVDILDPSVPVAYFPYSEYSSGDNEQEDWTTDWTTPVPETTTSDLVRGQFRWWGGQDRRTTPGPETPATEEANSTGDDGPLLDPAKALQLQPVGRQIVTIARRKTIDPNATHAMRVDTSLVTSRLPASAWVRDFRRRSLLPRFGKLRQLDLAASSKYRHKVQELKQWLLRQRALWGDDTPRALIALSLVENEFSRERSENDLLMRELELFLERKFMRRRNDLWSLHDSEMALYINALIATCQDPKAFLDLDLTEILRDKLTQTHLTPDTLNPTVFLSLCLADAPPAKSEMQLLEELVLLNNSVVTERQMLAVLALSCLYRQVPGGWNLPSAPLVTRRLNNLQQKADGSFGNVYRTALTVQAAFSVPKPSEFQGSLSGAFDHLYAYGNNASKLGEDMLAAYYIIPALSGRSLVHLRNTRCDQYMSLVDILSYRGRKTHFFFTMKVGYPETSSFSTLLGLPQGMSFFDGMRVVEHVSPQWKFLYEEMADGVAVYSISGIPNDAELNKGWYVYLVRGEDSETSINLRADAFTGDLRHEIPEENEEIIFWYLNANDI